FFNRMVVGSRNLSTQNASLGGPVGVTAANVAQTAWLISNDSTNKGFISKWALPTFTFLGQKQLPGPSVAVDGGPVFNGDFISIVTSGLPPKVAWLQGNGVPMNTTLATRDLPGDPVQLRMSTAGNIGGGTASTTWVAIRSPRQILGFVTNQTTLPPQTIDL